ncbi:MAG: MaoC/PaaZ C-terminal domain-containing protein [Acidimicrobiia bacterium]|nr:MaoC/PaaZ C-terminal domain-containing protein [Acidimicrobiia bacterium]
MPVSTDMVGATVEPMVHDVDERWTMAYAAALRDHLDCYLDTRRPEGVVAHPLFAVCPEWPIIVRSRELSDRWGITPDEVRRGVHATHDTTIHRLIRPGDRLTTTLEIVGVEQRKPGAYSTMRLVTQAADGEVVATTEQGSMYLGVPTTGPDRPASFLAARLDLPTLDAGAVRAEVEIPIGAGDAHTYTECARIWNPIHTDAAVAAAAGLPEIILHGTATLAHGVSTVVRLEAGGEPARVRRIVGRFGAMVPMPSTITVRILDRSASGDGTDAVRFEVRNQAGGPAVDGGVILLDA